MIVLTLDCETTGLKDPIGVCEIAMIELDPDTLETTDSVRSLIDPEQPISPSASGIHRITDDMVVDSPTLDEFFMGQLGNPFEGEDVLMVAHNAVFDYPLAQAFLGNSKTLCTLKLARRVYEDTVEDHKLSTLKYTFGLGAGGISHSALADVEDCADLLRKIVKDTGLSLAELMDLQDAPRIIKVCPFGKHKGSALNEVPKSYWVWLEKQSKLPDGSVDFDLAYSIQQIHPDLFRGYGYDSNKD